MGPAKFGPYFWGVLHLTCLSNIDQQALQNLVAMFPYILPCGACGQHFLQVLASNPFPASGTSIARFRWSVDVHNEVNKSIGKPEQGYDEAQAFWLAEPLEAVPDMDYLIILLLILLIITCFMRK